MYYYILPTNQDLQHHGVLGMKWDIRRYQSYDTVPRKSGKTGKEFIKDSRNKINKKISEEITDPSYYLYSPIYRNKQLEYFKNAEDSINEYERNSKNISEKEVTKNVQKYLLYDGDVTISKETLLTFSKTYDKPTVKVKTAKMRIKDLSKNNNQYNKILRIIDKDRKKQKKNGG